VGDARFGPVGGRATGAGCVPGCCRGVPHVGARARAQGSGRSERQEPQTVACAGQGSPSAGGRWRVGAGAGAHPPAEWTWRATGFRRRRHSSGVILHARRTATLVATVVHLQAASIDDCLELFDLIMTTELLGKAERETNKQPARDHPRLARASAKLAVAVEKLLEMSASGTISQRQSLQSTACRPFEGWQERPGPREPYFRPGASMRFAGCRGI
jgi:hypothetical protein